MNPPLIFVVVPTYNEANNLPELATRLMSLPLKRLHLLIVDDNSPDGTGQVAEDLKECLKGVHVLHRARKSGLGSAYVDGFRYALSHGADYVVQMDADLSHAPEHILEMLQHARRYDVVVGSRYVAGGAVDPGWSWWRHGLSRWANQVYVRAILGLAVSDATAGFKCWSRAALQAVLQQTISSSGYIFQVEMAYLAQKLDLSVLETPIYFEDRRIGRSKMSWSVKIEAVWRTWLLRWRHARVQATPTPQGSKLPAQPTPVSQFKLREY